MVSFLTKLCCAQMLGVLSEMRLSIMQINYLSHLRSFLFLNKRQCDVFNSVCAVTLDWHSPENPLRKFFISVWFSVHIHFENFMYK